MWQVIQSIFKYKLLKTSEVTQKDIELAIIKQTLSQLKKIMQCANDACD